MQMSSAWLFVQKKMILVAVYRSLVLNKANFLDFFDCLLFLSLTRLPFLIMEDINIDTIGNDTYAIDFNEIVLSTRAQM